MPGPDPRGDVAPTTGWSGSGAPGAVGPIDLRPLVAVAGAVTALTLLGAVPAWAGLAHHLALPPLDLFADVRLLVSEAPSGPWFVAGVVVTTGLRAAVLAAVLGALDRRGLLAAVAFYGVALLPALVAAVLGFTAVAGLYALFLWAGVAIAALALAVLGPRPWTRPGRRRYALPAVVAYAAALLVVSLASALGSAWLQVVLVWVSAGLTALTAGWMAGALHLGRSGGAGRRRAVPRGRLRPVTSALLVVSLMAVPAGRGATPAPEPAAGAGPDPGPAAATAGRVGTLFLVPGIGGSTGTSDMFRLDPAALGYDCGRTAYFSYAGPGDGGPRREARCPVTRGAPYGQEDTGRPLGELAASFRAQLAGLPPPVVVVTHSQGAWVAAAGLDGTVAPLVEAVVVLGGFPRHERGYQLDGSGAGAVGTDGLEAVMAGLRALGMTSADPRAPLLRDLLGTPGAVAALMDDAFPGDVRVATVTSAFDLPIMPRHWRLGGAVDLCPVYRDHGDLPVAEVVLAEVRRFLDGGGEDDCGWWRRWPTQAFTAFGIPARSAGRRRRAGGRCIPRGVPVTVLFTGRGRASRLGPRSPDDLTNRAHGVVP